LNKGKWQAVILVNTLGMAKILSNLHAGQYVGSISLDQSQGQVLVEPILLPGVNRHINKFLCKAAQEMGSGLAIDTGIFNSG